MMKPDGTVCDKVQQSAFVFDNFPTQLSVYEIHFHL